MRLIRLVWIQRKKLSWWRRHHFPWPVDLITRRGRKKESSEHLLSLSLRPICNRSQSYRTLKGIDGVEVDNLHFLRICIVFLACRHPFISMHFVSSSMVKEPQLWRSLNFSQACLLWNSFQERETTTLLALRGAAIKRRMRLAFSSLETKEETEPELIAKLPKDWVPSGYKAHSGLKCATRSHSMRFWKFAPFWTILRFVFERSNVNHWKLKKESLKEVKSCER